MNHGIDNAYLRHDEFGLDSVRLKQNRTPNTDAVRLGQPDVEDCSNGVIPDNAEPIDGKKRVQVPVLITMNKYLFAHYRLPMYSYVNQLLHNGILSRIVGARVLNSVINHETLSFPRVSFWRIDRTNFYADVRVQLKLDTQNGTRVWDGYLVLWCSFNGEFECSIEDMTDAVDRKDDGFDQLDSYLIPYYDNKRVDEVSEGIWERYLPEALVDPQKRSAVAAIWCFAVSTA